MGVPFHLPLVAIWTPAGAASPLSQQSMLELAVVVGICGRVHHVALLRGTPPRSDDSSCQGGTCSADGFETTRTWLESSSIVAVVLLDFRPSLATRACTSAGPPLFTIWGLPGSVTTLALPSACKTFSKSSCVRLSAKK